MVFPNPVRDIHYGYVGAFVAYLERRFGIEKIREYSASLSWGKHPEAVFAQVCGSPLAEIEGQFLADYRVTKGIEEEIEIIARPLVPRVVILDPDSWNSCFFGPLDDPASV